MKVTIHSAKFLALLLVFSTGVILFTAGVVAQDEGWAIQRADYGFKSQRTDVTDILRDLISRGGVNGRVAVNNQTMGGDPAVGRDKSLRIFARNRRNEEREFDFKEGGFIDVSLFPVRHDELDDRGPGYDGYDRGGRGRNDSRDLVILRGFYGVQGQTVNVTERLQSMVREGGLAVRVNNENLGGDPAIGADKILIVIYRFHGQEQATAVPEGNRLVIP
ncbi:MAG: DNAJC11 domain-containing protein [Candidatus Acidiferrales bacterium]